MPKVTEQYIEEKKNKIIEAAVSVCIRKTMSSVTMQDIIDECGFSQGGIYRFYKDIDEIFIDMIRYIRKIGSIKEEVKRIYEQDKEIKDVMEDMYQMLAHHMEKYLFTVNKISFELNFFISNYPERAHKIMNALSKEEANMEYLSRMTYEYFKRQEAAGKITPIIPVENILEFISVSYSGILTDVIIRRKYYGEADKTHQIAVLMKTLYQTTMYLLGKGEIIK